MSASQKTTHIIAKGFRICLSRRFNVTTNRAFTSTSRNNVEVTQRLTQTPLDFDPATVTSSRAEKLLSRSGIMPVGSRRRRAALKSSDNVPFEQLPYQCFQEARKLLHADRIEKLKEIESVRTRIERLSERDPSTVPGGEERKQVRLTDMRKHLEELKILADINDPSVKKRFEDGQGDMNKPIYRYLADQKWRSYQRLVTCQRIAQFHIVPDIIPRLDPTSEIRIAFNRRKVQPGDFIESTLSEAAPYLKVQVFDKGERLITVAVIDADVPDLENDTYFPRCHYLASNLVISPTQTSILLSNVSRKSQLALPWLPPFAQKGSPYHRYAVIVLEQVPGKILDVLKSNGSTKREGFDLAKFIDDHTLTPIGATVFRSRWDEGTAEVMQRAGIKDSDIEFRRKKIEPLKPKQKPRGWEARHASEKYRSLRR